MAGPWGAELKPCANEACGHAEFLHTSTCRLCKCIRFFHRSPIKGDEVLDAHERLKKLNKLSQLWTKEQWREALKEEKDGQGNTDGAGSSN